MTATRTPARTTPRPHRRLLLGPRRPEDGRFRRPRTPAGPEPESQPGAGPGPGRGPWRRGPLLVAAALTLALLLLAHAWIPDAGGLGSLVETFLPWCGGFVPVLLAAAAWRRSASAALALLLPLAAWLHLFGGLLGDRSQAGGDLTLVSHNVAAANPDPAATARTMAASGADILALEELSEQAAGVYEKGLAAAYPYHAVLGTVGVWSKLPLSRTEPVDLQQDVGRLGARKPAAAKLAEARALRTTVATRQGPLTVYVAHLGSVRVTPAAGFWTESRDRNARALGAALAAERSERVVLLGDLNGTVDDGALDGITTRLTSAQDAAGAGFGFSWPRSFPVARIDHILVRGVEPTRAWLLPATASDHLPVAAEIAW
ncbi:endonuclease/exonuclease/phosphatase family protein [Streptomyces sp. NPDC049813]|uniref:endonuclease/exonuclease/phosphatase family protein n=1 Tax=Streptomyces sp. NPDC049813 TaxID=3365597 RepID=UPI0037B069CE